MKTVAIIHPWMPQYRTEFFDQLIINMQNKEIELHVYYGQTPREWQERNDSAQPEFATELKTKFYNIRGRNISYKNLNRIYRSKPYDLIILEQAIRNLETYQLLIDRRTSKKIAFWGHGKTYTQKKNQYEENLKYWITNRGSWFFGYTHEGVTAMTDNGFPASQTTVVQNSIDTNTLAKLLGSVTELDKKNFRYEHGLKDGHTAIYMGGLDAAKRIDFLLKSAESIHQNDPNFKLIVAGNGSEANKVSKFADDNDWVIRLGAVFGHEKALALTVSDFMLNPGRVGLVAIDSLIAAVPIITTDWPYHAPEFSYIQHGETALVSADDVISFSNAANSLINDNKTMTRLKANCQREGKNYSTEVMVQRFSDGIAQALIQ